MGKVKAPPTPADGKPILRALNSKSVSCSELAKGHKDLLSVKAEKESPEELEAKIKEG